jgi:tetratricopeptide (TPR) repeat protein
MEIKSRLYNEAALLAEKSLSLDDSSLAAKDHLAHAYTCLGRFSEALKIYQPYAGRVYKTAGPWAEMGTVAGDLTDLAEIWPDGNDDPSYRQIVALAAPKPTTQPSSDDLARNFGQKAIDDFHLGHKQDSYDALRNALRISKKPGLTADTGILLTSAQSLIDPPSTQPSDDFADGLQQAAWAILKNPDQTADRYAKALDFARRSVAQHQTPANLSVLGAALYRTGELQAAIESLAKSDAADFVMRDYHVRNLAFTAMAQKRLGHEAEARAALQTIVDISRELDALVDDDFPCFNEAAAMIDPATTRPSTLPAEDSLVVKPAGELKGPPATQPADTPSDGKANFSRMAVYQFKLGHREYAKELLLKAWSAGESGLPRENPDAPLFESAWSLIDPHHGKPKNVYADGLNNAASAIASFPGKSEARYAEALDLARQAVSADDDPSNINTLGLAQYRAGDFKGAIVSLSRSNELDLFQDLRYSNAIYCAMALERLGKHGEAKATLSAAIKAQQYLDRDDPDDVGEDDARAVIEAARLILSPEEWFAIRFDAGYWPFSFGATPADTVAAIRKPWDTHWTDLRVAREYSGHDVRYVVVPINEVTMSTFGVDAVSKYSYACLLFEDGKLFKIALRFLNDAKVKDHQAVFDAVARSFGMDPADIADGQRITARSQRVMLEGTRNSHGTFIEFSLIDSPKPQGSEVVRLGIMPPPPVTQPAAEKPVVERPADETPAIRLKALDRPHPSAPNGARTTITFVNRSANEVQLFWLDTENTRHLLFGIAPGARLLEHSFVGHVFLVLGSDNSVRGVFEAIKDPAEAIIDGAGATTRPTTLPATLPAADPTTAPANRSN